MLSDSILLAKETSNIQLSYPSPKALSGPQTSSWYFDFEAECCIQNNLHEVLVVLWTHKSSFEERGAV